MSPASPSTRSLRAVAAAVATLLAVLAGALVSAAPAVGQTSDAAESQLIALSAQVSPSTLYGRDVVVALEASSVRGGDDYNLSFTATAPAGVAYVGGSGRIGDRSAPAPRMLVQEDGSTVLVWTNVSDLLTDTVSTLRFDLRPSTAVYDVGDTIMVAANAFANADARTVPDVDDVTGVGSGDITSQGSDTATTQLSPFDLTKREPSAERELLRGVHSHQTVFTLDLQNNLINATTDISIVDHIPAGLEYLGCGGVENTDPEFVEYAGASRLDAISAPSMTNPCVPPSTVATVVADPDADGPLPEDVYTRLEWNVDALTTAFGSANLMPGASLAIDYVAAVPMRRNVDAGEGDPTANLDNNLGALTADEDGLTGHARATGDYNGVVPSLDDAVETVVAEDVSVHKSASTGRFSHGSATRWTLLVESSEYAVATDAVVVEDTIPDGLDFSGSNPGPDAGFPVTNGDGTLTVRWTLDGFAAPSGTRTITVDTTTRSTYRADGAPVASRDAWTNTVALATTAEVIVNGDGSTDALATPDASAAGQSSAGPVVAKSIAEPTSGPLACADGAALTFDDTAAGPFQPGDRVCWRLTVDFAAGLDTLGVLVQDHLPRGFDYDSHAATAANGADLSDAFSRQGPLLTWELGDVPAGADRFEVVVQSIVTDPGAASPADLTANLLKVRHENSAGSVFQLRDAADAIWGEPSLDLVVGVIDVDDQPVAGAPADNVQIEAGDVVTFQVTVDNGSGNVDAVDASIRDVLADGLDCAAVSSISDGGRCEDGWVQWDGYAVAAGAAGSLTYDVTIPAGITAAVTLVNTAGVRQYEGVTNVGTRFVYVPASNIDPTLVANTTAADDTSAVHTARPDVRKRRTTSVSESGNAAANEATVGEVITYSIDATLPNGTTFYGPAALTDDLGERLDLDEGSVTATLDGGPLPASWVLELADNEVVLTLDAPHTVPLGADQLIAISFDATVTDVSDNVRSSRVRNRATLTWDDHLGSGFAESGTVNTHVVEPALTLAKSNDDADDVIMPGQSYGYELTVANAAGSRVSTAHDVVVVDTVGDQIIVLAADGEPAPDGAVIDDNGGVWDAETRTVTWNIDRLEPGATQVLGYAVIAADPLIASGDVANGATATATSLAGSNGAERDATSPNAGVGSGYRAEASDLAGVVGLDVAKEAAVTEATIGEAVDFDLTVTIPAYTIGYDVLLVDQLPAGLAFESLLSVTCTEAEGVCSSPVETVDVSSDGSQVDFFVGDVLTAAPADRAVTISYRAVVTDVSAAAAGAILTNTVVGYLNVTDVLEADPDSIPAGAAFDAATDAASADLRVVEPVVAVSKRASTALGTDEAPRAKPGATVQYTVTVTNPGGPNASDAFDIQVVDQPDARLTGFVDTTAAAGIAVTDSEPADGRLEWTVAGPIAPGESVDITYELVVPDGLDHEDEVLGPEVVNTVDVTEFFGIGSAERAANAGRPFRSYDGVDQDQAAVELDLASVGGRVWNDVDLDGLMDADEAGLGGVTVSVTYLGVDDAPGGGDDEITTAQTAADGSWVVRSLPAGDFVVDIDDGVLDPGMAPTYDPDDLTDAPDGRWSGHLAGGDEQTNVDFAFGLLTDGPDEGVGHDGDVWVVGVKPDGTALVRTRSADQIWSRWVQQGTAETWATMSINTDRAGNVWIVGVKKDGIAYVRTKQPDTPVTEGWSDWYRQGIGGWATMSLATDTSGNVWIVGVKTSGIAYTRAKNAGTPVNEGWSGWIYQGRKRWSSVTLATDADDNLWLAGVTNTGRGFVRKRAAGGHVASNWSSWVRQGSGSDWQTLNIATDTQNGLWIAGVKQAGSAFVRQKTDHQSMYQGWSRWLQLGASDSWASMTLTVDDVDTLWIAGVKHSGTSYLRMKCYCVGIADGWSGWWQLGGVNSWESMIVTTDPANRILVLGMKLNGTAYMRTKGTEAGINTGWSLWYQHGYAGLWDELTPHSNAWTGIQPPKVPTLDWVDIEWVAPEGWLEHTHVPNGGTIYIC